MTNSHLVEGRGMKRWRGVLATICCAERNQVGMFGEHLLNGGPQARKQKEHLICASKQRWSMKHEAGPELLRLSRLRCLWECLEAEFRFLKNTNVENLGSCRVRAGAEQNFWESMFWTKIPKPRLETLAPSYLVALTFTVLSFPFCKMKIGALSNRNAEKMHKAKPVRWWALQKKCKPLKGKLQFISGFCKVSLKPTVISQKKNIFTPEQWGLTHSPGLCELDTS